MAITRLGGANAITGTLPAANINNTSIGNVTSLPAAISTGKVLQVVQASTQTQVNNNTTTYASTGLTVNITPSSSSNKVLVLVQQVIAKSNADNFCDLKVLRGTTDISNVGGRSICYTGGTSYLYPGTSYAASILDNPNTSSQVTYSVEFKRGGGGGGFVRASVDSGGSYITVMEIET